MDGAGVRACCRILTSFMPCALSSIPSSSVTSAYRSARCKKGVSTFRYVRSGYRPYFYGSWGFRIAGRKAAGECGIMVVHRPRCSYGAYGFADMGHIRDHPIQLSPIKKHKERVFRSIHRRHTRRRVFISMLYAGTHSTSGHCRRKRQHLMGNSAAASIFLGSRHAGRGGGNIGRLRSKAHFK